MLEMAGIYVVSGPTNLILIFIVGFCRSIINYKTNIYI